MRSCKAAIELFDLSKFCLSHGDRNSQVLSRVVYQRSSKKFIMQWFMTQVLLHLHSKVSALDSPKQVAKAPLMAIDFVSAQFKALLHRPPAKCCHHEDNMLGKYGDIAQMLRKKAPGWQSTKGVTSSCSHERLPQLCRGHPRCSPRASKPNVVCWSMKSWDRP